MLMSVSVMAAKPGSDTGPKTITVCKDKGANADCKNIHTAIRKAKDGDTVQVICPTTSNRWTNVRRQINLVGAGMAYFTAGLAITADNVNVSGVTLNGTEEDGTLGVGGMDVIGDNNWIHDNVFTGSYTNLAIYGNYNLIENNEVTDGATGIVIDGSIDSYYDEELNRRVVINGHDNIVRDNLVKNNGYGGIRAVVGADNNIIYHNNVIDNSVQAEDWCIESTFWSSTGCSNFWYNPDINEGNYWSDWDGMTTPWPAAGYDSYPLMSPIP